MAPQHAREETVFKAAIALDEPAARAAYLAEACGSDHELRAAVVALLDVYDQTGVLERIVVRPATPHTPTAPIALGTVIGPYKLLQQIGEGGMAVVYMAEQARPVERQVALKVIKPGMDSRQVIARFEAEEQALAVMDHPNIAKVFEVGTTDTGRPYFVMELVKGVPITQYCDEHHLTPRQRLELFVPVCLAVQHAHQKGIIHRDLKPTNVLVAEYDDQPVPKVIDFGVAKAIGQRLTEQTLFTQLGQVVGTIDYMSPEQAKLNQLDIDIRSDVYSLGVLLYELLTGETPFDRKRLRSAAFDELLRIIREEEPPRPSVRLGSSQTLPSIAASRQIEPRKLSLVLRGELDWIVMKALEKDRDRRYETANAFAADLLHYLSDEAVAACSPSAAYRFRKFARRNRRLVTTAAAIGLVLLLASLVSTWQAVRATRAFRSEMSARKDAERSQRRAQAAEGLAEANFAKARAAVDEYLTEVTESELLSVPGLQPLRRDLLAAAGKFYESFVRDHGDQPDLQLELAAAHFRLGRIQGELGQSKAASQGYERAVGLLEAMRKGGQGTPAVKALLARAYFAAGRTNETARLCQEVLAGEPNSPEVSDLLGGAYNSLANAEYVAGRLDQALMWHQEAFALREQLARRFPSNPRYLTHLGGTLNNLGLLLSRQRRYREALAMYLQAIAQSQRAYELDPSSMLLGRVLAVQLTNAARNQVRLGLDGEALGSYERLVAVRRKVAWNNPAVAGLRVSLCQAWQSLARQQRKLGKAAEAQESLRAALEILENMPRQTAQQMLDLAAVYARLAQPPEESIESPGDHDPAEAKRNADLALQMLCKAVEAGYRDVQALRTSQDLAALRDREDFQQLVASLEKSAQAEKLAMRDSGTDAQKLEDRQTAAKLLNELVAQQPENLRHQQALATTLYAIGVIQRGLKQQDEAGRSFQRALEIHEALRKQQPQDRHLQEALASDLQAIAAVQIALKQYDQAERAFQRAMELREGLRQQQPDEVAGAIDVAEVRSALGRLYWDTDRRPEAHRLWQVALGELHQVAVKNAADQGIQMRVASLEREICVRYGAMGLFDLAATVAQHNTELKRVTDSDQDAGVALLLGVIGEQQAWREYCQYVVRKAREKGPGGGPTFRQVRTSLLFAPPVIDPEECIRAASKEVQASSSWYWARYCLALAQYRACRYADALGTIDSDPRNASWEAIPGETNKPACAYVCALAAQGDDRKEYALAQLERAERLYQDTCKFELAADRKELTDPLCRYFWNLAEAQVLRREAWQKIEGHAPPAEPWWNLIQARGYALIGESQRADKEFAAAVAAAPRDLEIRLTRSRLFQQLGDIPRAEADLNEALTLDPNDPQPLIRRALLHAMLGQHEEAEADLAQAGKVTPRPGSALAVAEARCALGRTCWDAGRKGDAHRLWEDVLRELHPIAMGTAGDDSVRMRILSCTHEICRLGGTDSLARLPQSDGWGLLFDGKTPDGWALASCEDFGGHLGVADGEIALQHGGKYTGIVSRHIVPLINYEIAYEVCPETPGEFATLVFPYGERYGRWFVGDNETVLSNEGDRLGEVMLHKMVFTARQWYRLRLGVTSEWIRALVNDQELLRVKTKRLGENWGNWLSSGSTGFFLFTGGVDIRVRNIRIRQIQPDPEQPSDTRAGPATTEPRGATTQQDATRNTGEVPERPDRK